MNIKVLVPTGALGIIYCKKALNNGLKEKPDIIVVDGGSTDSGPRAYLEKENLNILDLLLNLNGEH